MTCFFFVFLFLFLFFFNIPINMYSKDPKNVGRVILNAGETRTGTVHLKCVWSCLQMLFFLFVCLGFFCTSISCIGVIPCRHLCCLDTQYVMDAGKLFFFFSFSFFCLFVHVHTNVSPCPSCGVSCLYKHSAYSHLNHPAVIKYKF